MSLHASSTGRRRPCRIGLAALGAALSLTASAQADVILQYFESSWQTIERRMPDVFMAGYGAMWLPPAARADLGDFSVGFDVKDRFDLGNEFQKTLYGSETGLRRMISQAHRAGVLVYFDTVYNHNGFSDGYRGDIPNQTPCQLNWAIQEGGYPGFVMSGRDLGLPFNLEFRNVCPSAEFPIPSCDSDPINCRISNLIDINHNTDYRWIRHPVDPNDSRNIPYQQAKESNRRFYPDLDLPSPYDDGVRPFNLADEMQGDPFEENVNGMLQRATQWMLEVQGVDGFRLDAVKHTEAGWFSFIFDPIANDRRTDFWGRKVTPFSFGEHVTSDWGQLAAYHRKDGFGNRTVLDFPLKFTMQNNIGNPGGNFAQILDASFDGFDGDGQDGSAGVMFIQSHDNNFIGDPPALQNMAYAYILGRKGVPIVYYNAREFGADRFFPNTNTRGDALGKYGSTITTLVNINNNFVNGRAGNGYRSLWRDNDYIAYELNNTLIVGLNDRQDQGGTGFGYDVRNVSNLGYRNVTLTEITGNAKDPIVDPNDDIPDTITIPATGGVDLRVPSARNRNGVEHGKPYVMYAIDPPKGALTVDNVAFTIAPDVVDEGNVVSVAKGRLTPIDVVTADVAQVRLQIDQTGTLEDNALLRWNFGQNVDGDDSGDFGIAMGVDSPILAGYENFTTERSPSQGGGSGLYRLNVDLTNPAIPEGYNYLSAIAFVPRLAGLPPIFNTFRKVIYVDRRDPDMALVFPQNPDGTNDIQGTSYGFVVDNPDGTGNAMHYFWNLPEGTNPVDAGLLNDGNKATQTDRNRWRFSLDGLTSGDNQRLTVVLFEETGNYGLQTFLIGVNAGVTPTATPTGTPEPTSTPPITPTVSPTPTAGEGTPSPTSTPAPSPTIPEGTFTPTQTPNPTATVSPTVTEATPTATQATPTATEATPTATATEATPSPTASATEATPTVAPTGTTATPSPSQTTAAPTATPSATAEPTATTATPSPSATTPAGTATPSPSATAPTATPSPTETPLPSNPDGFLIRGGS